MAHAGRQGAIRRTRALGAPQRAAARHTLHGRDAVVVVDAQEFSRLEGERSGELLIDALRSSAHRQAEIEPRRSAMPVRPVKL